jgi:hypothetical protein
LNPLPTAWEAVALPGELLPLLQKVFQLRSELSKQCDPEFDAKFKKKTSKMNQGNNGTH